MHFAQQGDAAVEKWEYLFAEWQDTTPNGQVIRAVDGVDLPQWKSIPLEFVISLLGEDGWELAHFGEHTTKLIFKRPWTGNRYDVMNLVSKLQGSR